MANAFRGGETRFRIRIGALGATEPGRVLFENEFFGSTTPVSFLLLGHSLMDTKPRDALRSWNAQASITADGQQAITPGASLAYQWDNMPPATGVNARTYLASPGVDVFVAAEAGPITALGGSAGSPTLPLEYGDLWMQLAWANGARPLLMAIWPFTTTGTPGYISGIGASNGDTDPTMLWRPKLDHLRAHYEAIIGYIHARMPEGAAPLRLVPGDALMAALYDAALAGDLTGVAATETAFFNAVFDTGETDPIHLTLYGWYAVCCLHYACIYGQSPVGLSNSWTDQWDVPYSGMPSPTQAAELQAIAWAVAQADTLGPFGAQIPDDPYAGAGGGGAAAWWTPATSPQIIGPAADTAVTQGTLAWSYRWTGTELSASPPTPRMFTSDQFSFIEIAGGDDTTGRGIGSQLVNSSWSNMVTMANQGGYNNWLMPDTVHNFVLVWNSSGTLSGGMTCQLWWNGNLVRGSTSALSNVGMQGLRMFGDYGGANVNPGETQGWWYSNDTAMDPATMFADLFDGTNGMLDLNADPTVGGVYPDTFYIEPGAGPSSIAATASGSADTTGSATATVASTGANATASGSANVTGASTARSIVSATSSGSANTTGSATGTVTASAQASGSATVTGSATAQAIAKATGAGVADTTGTATAKALAQAQATGSAGTTGTATAAVAAAPANATASGAADTTGTATASTIAPAYAEAEGLADVTGTAAVATLPRPPRTTVVVSSRTSRRGTPYDFAVSVVNE